MNWQTEWAAIAGRIEGILGAGHFYVQAMQVNRAESDKTDEHLSSQAIEVVSLVTTFETRYQTVLPEGAQTSILRFLKEHRDRMSDRNIDGLRGVIVRLTRLAWLKAEVDFHLRDFQVTARRLSERAFVHLQSLIVVDPNCRQRWQDAFNYHETACERLGASHLLLHGIWAFKVSAEGARTDLVFGEPIREFSSVERAAEALVLTEWKLIRESQSVHGVAATARKQASLYGQGVLAGLELSTHRYVVLVSKDRISMPQDVVADGVVYRHIGIAVAPNVPSKSA
ncbi:MAG: hypothetical protein ABIE47_08360 [Pseudomonadota bacterium]